MKHTLFILALITASIQTFAQSPRIKLNQITKDSVTGSVLISSPTDSGMVYSRDLFISYGADTVLILGGDTISGGGGLSSVLSDGVTITGDGTLGSELTADTSVLATLRALSDSLALVISSVTADGVTITGDGTVGSPLKVDTATVIATKQDLDLYYLDSNPDGYTSNTGTVTNVAATAGTGISVSGSPITTSGTLTITNTAPDQTVSIAGGGINAVTGTYPSFTVTGTEVDGSVTNEIQDISTTGAAGNISISGGSTLNLNVDDADASATNEGSLTVGAGTASTSVISSNTSGSTDVTLTAGTNVTLSETGNNITISATGGGTTYNNISETADTVYISDYLDVDTATLYVNAVENRVGIGTSSPQGFLSIEKQFSSASTLGFTVGDPRYEGLFQFKTNASSFFLPALEGYSGTETTVPTGIMILGAIDDSEDVFLNNWATVVIQGREYVDFPNDIPTAVENADIFTVNNFPATSYFRVAADGGIFAPSLKDTTGVSANMYYNTVSDELMYITSSERYKTNIRDYDRGINDLMKLRPVYFQPKNSKNNNIFNTGFIAEEVEETGMVEYIDYDENGRANSIHYALMTSLLTKSIQEQQTIIETQATEIEQLKTQIQLILSEIEQIKNN